MILKQHVIVAKDGEMVLAYQLSSRIDFKPGNGIEKRMTFGTGIGHYGYKKDRNQEFFYIDAPNLREAIRVCPFTELEMKQMDKA